jgi:hypothetical protein
MRILRDRVFVPSPRKLPRHASLSYQATTSLASTFQSLGYFWQGHAESSRSAKWLALDQAKPPKRITSPRGGSWIQRIIEGTQPQLQHCCIEWVPRGESGIGGNGLWMRTTASLKQYFLHVHSREPWDPSRIFWFAARLWVESEYVEVHFSRRVHSVFSRLQHLQQLQDPLFMLEKVSVRK